MVSII
jgi:ribonuclease HI